MTSRHASLPDSGSAWRWNSATVAAALGMLLMVPFFVHDAKAQATQGNGGSLTLPATGSQSPAGAGQTCVQAKIAGEAPPPYSCLNQQLQQEVQGAGAATPSLPLTASSPSNKVGTYNEQSIKEQYGQNYGKSVIPYRPPAPVYSSGLHP